VSVVALCVDLMDRSKLAAAHPGAVLVRSAAALDERLAAGGVDLVIVDLSRGDALDAIVCASSHDGVRVVAYGSHVDDDRLAAAQAAGAHEVLPRSRFFARLG
jgi:DNA-binding NarL/FixJ family response regulator